MPLVGFVEHFGNCTVCHKTHAVKSPIFSCLGHQPKVHQRTLLTAQLYTLFELALLELCAISKLVSRIRTPAVTFHQKEQTMEIFLKGTKRKYQEVFGLFLTAAEALSLNAGDKLQNKM